MEFKTNNIYFKVIGGNELNESVGSPRNYKSFQNGLRIFFIVGHGEWDLLNLKGADKFRLDKIMKKVKNKKLMFQKKWASHTMPKLMSGEK